MSYRLILSIAYFTGINLGTTRRACICYNILCGTLVVLIVIVIVCLARVITWEISNQYEINLYLLQQIRHLMKEVLHYMFRDMKE